MKDLLENFPFKQVGTYATITGIFIYNVLSERDVECTCKDKTYECIIYMTVPIVIILLLLLWINKPFQRLCRHEFVFQWTECKLTCLYRKRFLCIIFYHIFKALFLGLLWIVVVLIDGDWYVCCLNDGSKKQEHLACKDKKDITADEKLIIAKLKDTSKVSVFTFYL